jgi:hypothetical protein
MDAEQIRRVEALCVAIRAAIDREIDPKTPAHDVVLAMIARAVVMSKLMRIDENEFFDTVVTMYEATSVEFPENH